MTTMPIGVSFDLMIRVEGTTTADMDDDFSDALASHQRILAMLVERREVSIEPDPWLSDPSEEEELESRLYDL